MSDAALAVPAVSQERRSTQRVRGESMAVRILLIGVSLAFLALFLLLPLVSVFVEAGSRGFAAYKAAITEADAVAAIRLTLLVAAIAVPFNIVVGIAAAWAIAKFEFRGKNLLISLIDLPFSVSPVISGLVYVLLFGAQGYFGAWLKANDVQIIFALPGLILATVFVTFPFVARELIPHMQALGSADEEAALTLGASGWRVFFAITLPNVKWSLFYGVLLCNARAMGEFGAVAVVSGKIRGLTNTMPLHVEILYNEYMGAAAFAVASLLAGLALVTLALKTLLEWRYGDAIAASRRHSKDVTLMSVAVTIESIEKRFDAFAALRGVSLDIQPAELVALLGPSGSGKTTLLRLIAGLDQADRGRVMFGDTDMRELSLRDRRIGFVFQHYALFKTMTVAENVAFGLKSRPRSQRPDAAEIRKRVGDLLDLVQLPGLERRYPSQLSGGQRQRVALARALAIEPRVLLLDEPFGALDAKVRKDLRAWLRDLHQRTGHTTVFVTHDQEEALELADRVAILNDGRLEQVGTPDDVYDHPASPFVCEFLGEANKLPVKVVGSQAFLGDRPVLGGLSQNQGGQASLYVRPQHLRIVDDAPLSLPGVVEHLRRNGPLRRAEVAVQGLAKRLDVDLASQVAPAIGERIRLRITHGSLFAAA